LAKIGTLPRKRPSGIAEIDETFRLETAHELRNDREPGRIGDDLLAAAGLERKDLQLFFIAVDQAAKKEPSGGPGNEDIAIQGTRIFLNLQGVAPKLIASAIVADACGHEDCYMAIFDGRGDYDCRLARSSGAAVTDDGGYFQLGRIAAFDEVLGIDAERLCNAVEPSHGHRSGARFQPADRLRSGWRIAAASDIVESHSACAPNLANSCDHLPSTMLTNQFGF